jgi:hypothetical protein
MIYSLLTTFKTLLTHASAFNQGFSVSLVLFSEINLTRKGNCRT